MGGERTACSGLGWKTKTLGLDGEKGWVTSDQQKQDGLGPKSDPQYTASGPPTVKEAIRAAHTQDL